MPFSTAYVGFVGGAPVCHIGMSGKVSGKRREARACRMVVKPEWQGAGVGMRMLNYLAERELRGEGFIGKPTTTLMHTAHPGLVAALRRDLRWRQVSATLGQKKSSVYQWKEGQYEGRTLEWPGHLRAVGGFRYYGDRR